MAKRKSGALKTAKFPPPSPFRSKPYSLGDVEYRAEMQKYLKDDPTAQLAMRRIEQLTGGDYGQVIKYILPRKEGVPKSKSEKRLDEVVQNYFKDSKASALETNLKGLYLPTEKMKGSYKGQLSKSSTLPEIFIQQPEIYKQEIVEGMSKGKPTKAVKTTFAKQALKEATKEGTKFEPGYFERLLERLGIKDVDRSLERRRKEGTMPTKEDMQEAKEIMPFEQTTRHELDHFGLDLLRALGYKLPYIDTTKKEEQFVGMLDSILEAPGYKNEPSEATKFGYDLKDQIDAMAREALKKERGYKMGGLVAMLKSFK